jgi:hypothetical protein
MRIDKHIYWMIIGCALPLLFIFLAPALGITGSVPIILFIAAMFACHLLIPMHHPGGHEHPHGHEHEITDTQTSIKENHEHHQH